MHTARAWFVALLVASGCDCGKPNVVARAGELGVVVPDGEGGTSVGRELVIDFGAVVVGEEKPADFTVRNVGAGALVLQALVALGPDMLAVGPTPAAPFSVDYAPRGLEATHDARFDVWFAPAGPGVFESRFTLPSDVGGEVTVTLRGRAEVGRCRTPAVIDFGEVPLGVTVTLEVALENATEVSATANAGDVTGVDATAFGYAPGSPRGPIEVAPGTQATLRFTFTPTEERSYRGTLALKGAGPCSTVNVPMKGDGTKTGLTWTPRELDFGFVPPGQSKTLELTFENPATASLEVRDITIGTAGFGSNPAHFTAQPGATDPTRLTVRGKPMTTSLRVACAPMSLGQKTATLTFKTNVPSTPSGSVSLICRGGGPAIRASPNPLAFGRVPAFTGSSKRRVVRVANVGTAPPTPDVRANLMLGANGLAPYVQFEPDPGTLAGEVRVSVDGRYDPAVGLQATAGKNEVDVEVVLSPTSPGAKSGTLVVFSNDLATPALRVPVTALAVDASPCNARVEPGQLDFGVVPFGTKDLSFSITNQGTAATDLCFITGLGLESSSHAAFSLVGVVPPEVELLPGARLDVTVRATGPTSPLTALVAATGAVAFDVSEPSASRRRVPLAATLGSSCLVATPEPVDFGAVKLGCQSALRTVNLYNACATPLVLKAMSLANAAGQAAGGPQCAQATACPEFVVAQAPMLPPAGLTLTQGAAPIAVQLRYRPIDLGADQGLLTFSVEQNGVTTLTAVPLAALANADGRQTDVFQQNAQAKADVLFVIDDSCSMGTKLTSLATNASAFSQYAATANVDYRLAVTTTTPSELDCVGATCMPTGSRAPQGRFFQDSARMIPPVTTATNAWAFAGAVQSLGTTGSGVESGLHTAVLALTPPLSATSNAGFVRADASLAVVVVTDAGDQSPQPVSYYLNRLVGVKGASRRSSFTFNVIGPLGAETAACPYDATKDPSRYQSVATSTSGITQEICTPDWNATLQAVGRRALGFRTQFFLNAEPDLSNGKMIDVLINGQPPATTTYTYDPGSNSLNFLEASTPTAGQTLTVSYDTACL